MSIKVTIQTQVELLWTWLSIDLITCYVSLTFWGLRKWLQRVFITSFFIIIRRGNICWPCMQQRRKLKVLQTCTAIKNSESGHAAAGVQVVLTQRKVNRCYFCCLFTGLNAWSTVRWLSLEVLSFKVVLPNCDSRGRACLFSLRDSSRTVTCECFDAFSVDPYEDDW